MVATTTTGSLAGTITFNQNLNLYTVAVGTSTADLQAAVNGAAKGAVFEFSSGTHTLTQTLAINTDGVVLRGAADGSSKVVIASNVTGTGISFMGGVDKSYQSTLDTAVTKGSTTIMVDSALGLKAGDVIRVSQSNDLAFIKANYANILGDAALKENPLRETIVEVAAVNGNTVTLKQAVAYDMAAGACTTVERLNMLDNVGIKNLSVTYTLGTANANSFTNAKAAFVGADAVVFNYTKGAQVEGLTVTNAASTALEMRNALEANVNNLTVSGAHNKDDGNGYGLHIAGSFNSTYQNLNITDVRHSVVFSSWNAEVNNTIHVANTNRDINYHGSDDYGNVVIVDKAVYKEGLGAWSLVSGGGLSHAETNIDLNTTLFGYAKAGSKNDVLYGKDGGSKLYGMGGNDVLFGGTGSDLLNGGSGNDVLYGGQGRDQLYGGGGRDTFVIEKGEANDTLCDFKAGKSGDTVRLVGYDTLKAFADLKFTQSAAGTTVKLSDTETLFLKGVTATKLLSANFVFDDGTHIDAGKGMDLLTCDASKAETIEYSSTAQFGDVIQGFSTMLEKADTLDLTLLFEANGLGAHTVETAFAGGYLALEQAGASSRLNFDKDGAAGTVCSAKTVATFEDTLASSFTTASFEV